MSELSLAQARLLNLTINVPGQDTVVAQLSDMDDMLYQYVVTVAILGASVASMVVVGTLLALVCRKRRSVMFLLYETNFVLGIISHSIIIRQYTEPDHNITSTLVMVAMSDNARNLAVAGSFMSFFFIMSMICSLSFQVYIAYKDIQNITIKLAVALVVFLADFQVAFIWLWQVVVDTINAFGANQLIHNWTSDALWPCFAAMTLTCSLLLSVRLFFICRARARLGLEKFDTIKIIFIVAINNSTLPALFAVLYSTIGAHDNNFPESVGVLTTLLCAIFFPIGYIWAQAKGETNQESNNGKPLIVKSSRYWSQALASAASDGSGATFEADKEGNRFRTREIE